MNGKLWKEGFYYFLYILCINILYIFWIDGFFVFKNNLKYIFLYFYENFVGIIW